MQRWAIQNKSMRVTLLVKDDTINQKTIQICGCGRFGLGLPFGCGFFFFTKE